MSFGYKQNNQTRPFAYGYTGSPRGQQSRLQECQGQAGEGIYNLNMENPTNIPQQHPDGPAASPNRKGPKDALNFGWFSLPHNKNGCTSDEDRIKSPQEIVGAPDSSNSPEINQRPLSKDGHRPDSQQRTTPQQGRHSSSRESPLVESQIPVNHSEMNQPDINNVAQGYGNVCYNQPTHEDNTIVDWPISVLAREHVYNQQNMSKPCMQTTPMTRSEQEVPPPTPLPPLHWMGYQSNSRPTYASWHDRWHSDSGNNPTFSSSHGRNTNNNCDKEASKGQGTNINNNNDIHESLANSACLSNNASLGARNYAADGNNNNWMTADDHGPSSRTQVRTLPPYRQSGETFPRFYNPSVVMKWEDTDDPSYSLQEKQTFKPISLMKRIRSSFTQMWSILSCIKYQDDEEPEQRSRLFKYDRFDYDKKSKNNTQIRPSGQD